MPDSEPSVIHLNGVGDSTTPSQAQCLEVPPGYTSSSQLSPTFRMGLKILRFCWAFLWRIPLFGIKFLRLSWTSFPWILCTILILLGCYRVYIPVRSFFGYLGAIPDQFADGISRATALLATFSLSLACQTVGWGCLANTNMTEGQAPLVQSHIIPHPYAIHIVAEELYHEALSTHELFDHILDIANGTVIRTVLDWRSDMTDLRLQIEYGSNLPDKGELVLNVEALEESLMELADILAKMNHMGANLLKFFIRGYQSLERRLRSLQGHETPEKWEDFELLLLRFIEKLQDTVTRYSLVVNATVATSMNVQRISARCYDKATKAANELSLEFKAKPFNGFFFQSNGVWSPVCRGYEYRTFWDSTNPSDQGRFSESQG
ncbi:hypothetical protein JAAARDRAFT_39793 [Jaapia argillacea MUCL 33604]|uniref:Uncharacterized protein n=1 Tax=Jaapia argillacea MUCL 33604 TaxID=933084 RepID=A0A067PR66_9AGAM|nr:hypothetical protein JAAARDRAFT_39793 [Jaapia argillacea MUCL 33604]